MIKLTNVNTVELVKKAYELSRPQGLGFLHFIEGDTLTDEEAKQFIMEDGTVNMDYVKGRACKFHTFIKNGEFFINDNWYDHTDTQLKELLKTIGIQHEKEELKNHGVACNCDDCRQSKGSNPYNPQKHFQELIKDPNHGIKFMTEDEFFGKTK
jgi:hypothetical protein